MAVMSPNTHGMLEVKYNRARANLLAVFGFTILNIILQLFNASIYLLFSASVPYLLVNLMWDLTGHLPPAAYAEDPEFVPLPNGFLYAAIGFAAFILLFYLMSYLFSKDGKYGWMIVALVFFSLDCAFLLGFVVLVGFDASFILDILFHVWVMYYLISGVSSGVKMARLPVDDAPMPEFAPYTPSSSAPQSEDVTPKSEEITPKSEESAPQQPENPENPDSGKNE